MNVDFLESILYYDCELLFEAVDAVGQRYIAVHAGECPSGCRNGCEYAVAPASQSDLAAFKAGTIGLRSLLPSHPTKQWYTARLGADGGPIALAKQPTPITEGCANLLEGDYYLSATDYSAAQSQEAALIPA